MHTDTNIPRNEKSTNLLRRLQVPCIITAHCIENSLPPGHPLCKVLTPNLTKHSQHRTQREKIVTFVYLLLLVKTSVAEATL